LKIFSTKAPKIDPIRLKIAKQNIKNCQISFKLSKIFKNNQLIKKITVNLEKIDKNVIVGKGDPP